MLSAESLDELLEAVTAPGDALKIYCAISTAKKWQAFEKTPALDARDRENAAAVLASEPTARAMRATLLGMGVKPRKYNEEEMQAALKQIAARGRVGLLRGPRARRLRTRRCGTGGCGACLAATCVCGRGKSLACTYLARTHTP